MNIGNLINRVLLVVVPAFLVVHQSGGQSSAREMPSEEQIVRVSASMFEFTPSENHREKGRSCDVGTDQRGPSPWIQAAGISPARGYPGWRC